jgi:hypothetical protein
MASNDNFRRVTDASAPKKASCKTIDFHSPPLPSAAQFSSAHLLHIHNGSRRQLAVYTAHRRPNRIAPKKRQALEEKSATGIR